jgi:carboxypeptidase Q
VNRTFSTNLSAAEFYIVQYTRSANFPSYVPITVIPNVGCTDADWLAASPSPSGLVALVKRGDCTFVDKAALASKYNVAALLIYNDGTAPDRVPPMFITLGQTNELTALFLSYTLGQELANAAQNPSNNVGVRLIISLANDATYPVGNICADTPTGDVTQTIVIGSHSDSVPAGPGINDNGKCH